jgi:hypothetical protein
MNNLQQAEKRVFFLDFQIQDIAPKQRKNDARHLEQDPRACHMPGDEKAAELRGD